MPARWSADSVLALASDDASRRAAIPLGRLGQWTDAGTAGFGRGTAKLYRSPGAAALIRTQLDQLSAVTALANVTFCVIPLGADRYPLSSD